MSIYTGIEPNGNDISYEELAKRVGDCILANTAREEIAKEYWDIAEFCGQRYNEEYEEFIDVYQSYIISKQGAEYLRDYTNEIVVYSEELDLYFWEITHYGTAWSHVFTSVKE